MSQATAIRPADHRSVWALAGPMIISNISVPLVGAVDTAVVGHLPGPHHIGAVALGAVIFSFLYWGFGFLRMGTTGFIARTYGARDHRELARIMVRVTLLALALGVIVIGLGKPLIQLALYWLDSSPQVESGARQYAEIRIWSAPATLLVYVFTGIFIGLHKTRHALILQIVLNLTNVALDFLFVPLLQFGVPGVAWATLIAEYTAVLTGFWLLRQPLIAAFRQADWKVVLSLSALTELMTVNANIFIRTLCLVFSFAIFTAQSAKLGDLVLAANTVLLHLNYIMAYALDGFAHAAEALAGSAYGAKKKAYFRKAVSLTTLWAGITATILCVVYGLFGPLIITLFTDIQAVLDIADQYLVWIIISPIVSIWSFQLDGIFIGTGHAKEMRNAMLVSTAGYLAVIFICQPLWHNHGLFFALTCFMALRAITLGGYFRRLVNTIEAPLK